MPNLSLQDACASALLTGDPLAILRNTEDASRLTPELLSLICEIFESREIVSYEGIKLEDGGRWACIRNTRAKS